MAEAVKAAPKPTNPPKAAPKAGEVPIEDRVDYKIASNITGEVIRTVDGVRIPNDPNNPDRVAYEAWGMAGGVAIPADVPPEVAAKEAAAKTPANTKAPAEMQATTRSTTVRE